MKICTKCKLEKNNTEFYSDKRKKDGLRSQCKVCVNKANNDREKNYTETRKKYRFEHQEEIKANKRRYYLENKGKILKDNAAWRQTLKGRLVTYKTSAKKRGIEWLLTEKEFESFWQQKCYYCNDDITTIGIDRIDSNGNYTIDNCNSCCSTCNLMKNNLSEKEFINKLKQIIKNLKNK